MKLATKLLWGYLAVTSVILHLVFLVLFIPAMRDGWQLSQEFIAAQQGKAAHKATVKDVSTLKDGEYTYTGYALEYQGQTLYAAGSIEQFKVGDQVALVIQKSPYAPIKSLIVLVMKDGR
jgi:hypothetical protein